MRSSFCKLPQGELPYKKDGVLVTSFRVKKAVLVPLRVFRLKSPIVEAVGYLKFRVSSQKIVTGDI